MSQRPGMRNRPFPSTTAAPAGVGTEPAGPTRAIRSPSTTTVVFGRRRPVSTSTTVTSWRTRGAAARLATNRGHMRGVSCTASGGSSGGERSLERFLKLLDTEGAVVRFCPSDAARRAPSQSDAGCASSTTPAPHALKTTARQRPAAPAPQERGSVEGEAPGQDGNADSSRGGETATASGRDASPCIGGGALRNSPVRVAPEPGHHRRRTALHAHHDLRQEPHEREDAVSHGEAKAPVGGRAQDEHEARGGREQEVREALQGVEDANVGPGPRRRRRVERWRSIQAIRVKKARRPAREIAAARASPRSVMSAPATPRAPACSSTALA